MVRYKPLSVSPTSVSVSIFHLRLCLGLQIFPRLTNNFADYKKIAGITNYFGVEFLKISFYLILFVKMDFFRQKERIQVIKYIYLF